MDLTEAEFEAANRRGEAEAGPRAIAARYDRRRKRIVVRLETGVEFSFRAADAEGLADASPEALARIEISRTGLHWEELDADLSIAGLMAGRLGSAKWMARKGAA